MQTEWGRRECCCELGRARCGVDRIAVDDDRAGRRCDAVNELRHGVLWQRVDDRGHRERDGTTDVAARVIDPATECMNDWRLTITDDDGCAATMLIQILGEGVRPALCR